MRFCLSRQFLVAWILVSGLPYHVLAQCPTRNQLQATVQRLLAEADPRGQVGTLQNWQQQWQQCNYPIDSTYISGLLQLGLAHHARNELPRATQIVQEAVRLCETRRPDMAADQPAKALYRLGTLLTDQSQPAMNTLKQAIRQGQGIRSAARWVGNSYLYLANAYYSAGDFQQALNCIERGEQMAGTVNDRSLMTKLLDEKAETLNVLEQYGPARQAAERALVLWKQAGYPAMIAKAYRLLGIIAKNQLQFTDALQYTQRAFAIAQQSRDVFFAPYYAVAVGTIYYELHRYDQAIPYFQYGFDNHTNAYAKASSLTMLGQVYHQRKAFPKALEYYQWGLTIMPLGFRNPAVTSLPGAESIRVADQKDYLLTLIQDKADTWLDYAKATGGNRQRLQSALDTYKVADQMIDYMRWDHTAQESKLYWRHKTRATYERAIETCYQLDDTEQAFRFMEKSRAVMLADKLNELGARQQLSETQAQTEKKLREAVGAQQNKLAALTPDSANHRSVRNALGEKQEKLDAFLKQLETSNPAYYRYRYDTTTTKLAVLKDHLAGRKASFVTYFVGDSALYLLAVTGDKATLHRQPIRGYSQTAQEFMALLANPDSMNRNVNMARFLKLGNALYRQLLAPLNLPEGSVIVSSDGSSIPFEVLSRSAGEPDYLVKHYAFSYEYSARRLLRNERNLSRVAGLGKRDFLGVAPVTFAAALKQVSLPKSDEALKPIAARFESPVLLTGPQATSRAFVAEAADSRVIQLFTHATADTTNSEPLLYFADATLRLSDLGDGGLTHTQLAVLAACKTGIGANQRGEGVFSLARGFAALGVPSVLTTLWSVENKATYAITDLFYRHLDEGLSKDIALQRAKQEWLRTASGADLLPNVWAGLILIGDATPLNRPPQWAWITAGGVLLLGAIGGAWWRRKRNRKPIPNVVLVA